MAFREYLVGEVAQDWADGILTRREALRRLGIMGVGVASASALLAACGSDSKSAAPASAASTTTSGAATTSSGSTPASTTPPEAETIRFAGPEGELQAAWAAPAEPRAAILVAHENRGLTPHFFDLVGRLAQEGYAAMCVDLLSADGGTASLADPGQAPALLAAAPAERLVGDLRAGIDELQQRVPDKKIGAIGFCFGGGMVWTLLNAGEDRLAAAVPFYGPAPEAPDFAKAKAAVLAIYGELDSRVNATRERAEAALKQAGLTYEVRTFAGADHAFFNDTGPRYNEQAATEAYAALLAWFEKYL